MENCVDIQDVESIEVGDSSDVKYEKIRNFEDTPNILPWSMVIQEAINQNRNTTEGTPFNRRE